MAAFPVSGSKCDVFSYLEELDLWDEAIVSPSGEKFFRLQFDSELHETVCSGLRDSKLSKRIWKSCQDVLRGCPSQSVQECEQWLKKHVLILSCPERFLCILQKTAQLASLEPLFRQYFSCLDHEHSEAVWKKTSKCVTIITTSGGGGEFSVAKAIHHWLSRQGCLSQFVDLKQVTEGTDSCFLAAGFHSSCIYSQVFQQGNDRSRADDLWFRNKRLNMYIPNETNAALYAAITDSTEIINTCYFDPLQLALAYRLNRKMHFVHCDYVFSSVFIPYLPIVDPLLIKFTMPHESCQVPYKVDVLGYPTPITPTSDPERVEFFKEKWGGKDRKVVMMMIGKNGVGNILNDVLSQLNAASADVAEPIHVIVICGRNQAEQAQLSHYLATACYDPKVSYRVCGELSTDEMSECYSIAHMLFGKSGGAATSELIQALVFGLLFPGGLTELEGPNLDFIERLGLARRYDFTQPFVDQLNVLLSRKKPERGSLIDWKERLQALMIDF